MCFWGTMFRRFTFAWRKIVPDRRTKEWNKGFKYLILTILHERYTYFKPFFLLSRPKHFPPFPQSCPLRSTLWFNGHFQLLCSIDTAILDFSFSFFFHRKCELKVVGGPQQWAERGTGLTGKWEGKGVFKSPFLLLSVPDSISIFTFIPPCPPPPTQFLGEKRLPF